MKYLKKPNMKFYVGLAKAAFLMVGTASAQPANFGVKGGLI
jgi:hypothetical protein